VGILAPSRRRKRFVVCIRKDPKNRMIFKTFPMNQARSGLKRGLRGLTFSRCSGASPPSVVTKQQSLPEESPHHFINAFLAAVAIELAIGDKKCHRPGGMAV
jgi:hypothetical protein